jgi:radical SAM superfamily enzyme YgiQ (UPF0313 family)
MILAAVARDAGYDVEIMDCRDGVKDLPEARYYGFSCATPQIKEAKKIARMVKGKTIIGGAHASLLALDCVADFDYVVRGEGEEVLLQILAGNATPGIISAPRIQNLDALPYPAWDMVNHPFSDTLFPGERYGKGELAATLIGSRGCPFSCLRGDTPVDTLNGRFAIKDLVGQNGVKVLTRDPITKEPKYASAFHIAKYGENKSLVRVWFDDDSHIDCTPDHKFIVFKNGNQFGDVTEREVEAQDLQPRQSVRAIVYREHPKWGYIDVEYGRHLTKKQHRLVMEGYLGRPLTDNEDIHHLDRNRENNVITNLALTDAQNHVPQYHPEVSARMRENNPMFSADTRRKVSQTQSEAVASGRIVPFMCTDKGKAIISEIAKKRALSSDNPLRRENRHPAPQVNHKVVRVENLNETEDVYCLEVPGYDWFYANNVLVHNCSFCGNIHTAPVRFRSAENILGELMELISRGVRHFRFEDDCFTIHPEFEYLCRKMMELGIHYKAHTRSDLLTPEKASLLALSGCEECGLGVESADNDVLRINNKKETVDDHKRAISILKGTGMRVKTYFVMGLPGETAKTLDCNKAFVRETQIDKWTVSTFCPYPGCPVFKSPGKFGIEIIDKDFSHWWNYCELTYNHVLLGQRREDMWARYKEFYGWLTQGEWKR